MGLNVHVLVCLWLSHVICTFTQEVESSDNSQSEEITADWENFAALEADNPELAWEKLKLWFKNNGNIQHVKEPWKDFKIFKDTLITAVSEEKIEEAWKEFEKAEEELGDLSSEDKVDAVVDKFREFYSQVKEDGVDENMNDGEDTENEVLGQEIVDSEEITMESVPTDDTDESEDLEADENVNTEVVENTEIDVPAADTEPQEIEGDDHTAVENTDADTLVQDLAENSDGISEEQLESDEAEENMEVVPEEGLDQNENIDEGVAVGVEGDEHTGEMLEETDVPENENDEVIPDVGAGEDDQETNNQSNQAVELEKEAAAELEAVRALSKELLAKLDELAQENAALKERISTLESGIALKMETITSNLEELRKEVHEEEETEMNSSATNVQEVQDLISKSLKRYAADDVGMPDYALESSGAVVFTIGDTEPYTRDTPWMGVFGISIWRSCKTPRLAIQKDNSPGNCWSFTGDKGSLTIQLSAQVFPEYFTIDHIPLELAPNGNASSAPNHFRVLGLDYGNAPKGHVLGNYEFTEFPIQTFPVQQNPYEKFFRFVKVEILSNHGNKDYTCLYRFRVHGRPHDTETYNG